MTDYNKIFENMVERTKDYLIKNNLKSMVLGLSGGIDSTVVAIVCHEISRRTNHQIQFIGVSLPSKTNENEENEIANGIGSLCDNFHIHSIENDFRNIANSFDDTTCSVNFGGMNPLQEGNIKARIRMMYLYNIASMTRGVTMDTDNMTEHLQGFFTIHGDHFDLNCGLHHLFKHEVYEFARYLYDNYNFENKTVKKSLERSINIIPTDGNGVMSGGDLAQIAPGLTYSQVDEVLWNEISNESDETKEQNLQSFYNDFGKNLVDGIIRRYHNTKFKRKPMPIVMNID